MTECDPVDAGGVKRPRLEDGDGVAAPAEPDFGFMRRSCAACNKSIINSVQVVCAECTGMTFCVQCFAKGNELKTHKKTHKYMPRLHFNLFNPQWGADEELLLIEALEMYGVGNWEDVAEHVGTKTPTQCAVHFSNVYLSKRPLSSMCVVPEGSKSNTDIPENAFTVGLVRLPSCLGPLVDVLPGPRFVADLEDSKEGRKTAAAAADGEDRMNSNPLYDGSTPVPEAFRTYLAEVTEAPNLASEGHKGPQEAKDKNWTPTTPLEMAGYMPERGDFETEYVNDAEEIIKDLALGDDDTPEEFEWKLKLLQLYMEKLDERERRKQFLAERGLLDNAKLAMSGQRYTKEQKEAAMKVRTFARYMSPDAYDAFHEGIMAEMLLKKRIEEMQEYRRLGCLSYQDCYDYESRLKSRENELASRRARNTVTPVVEKVNPRTSSGVSVGMTPIASVQPYPRAGPALDVSQMPGADVLLPKENNLCNVLRLTPQAYLVIKQTLITECFKRGCLKRLEARKLVKIGTYRDHHHHTADVNKTGKIFDYFVSCGWINTDPNMYVSPTSPSPYSPPPVTMTESLAQPSTKVADDVM